jgi:hypothetical protein
MKPKKKKFIKFYKRYSLGWGNISAYNSWRNLKTLSYSTLAFKIGYYKSRGWIMGRFNAS